MTALKIISKATDILGIKNDSRVQESAKSAINMIYADLFFLNNKGEFMEISDLSQPINLSSRLIHDVMVYGVAYILAGSLGDEENEKIYREIYFRKRTRQVSTELSDILPTVT